jgi:hypothetical protein
MQWVVDNWLLVVLFGGMGAMHLFGHGGHGGHGKRGKRGKHDGHDGQDKAGPQVDRDAANDVTPPAGEDAGGSNPRDEV